MRRAILILSLLGAGIFAGSFFLSFAQPLLVERAMGELLRIEVEREVGQRLDASFESGIVHFAQRALGRTDAQIETTRQQLREEIAGKVADVAANMLDADCTCRQRLVEYAHAAKLERLDSLQQAREQLTGLVESAYSSVRASLLREFRIFTGSNAVALALLAFVTVVRKQAKLQLLLPALVVFGAVGLTGGLYLLNQDWLHTIVFGDYLGWGYVAYLSLVVALLADIQLNRARVTTHVLNLLFNIVGSAASVTPC